LLFLAEDWKIRRLPVHRFQFPAPSERLKRGVFLSLDDLKAAINRFLANTNADPKPLVWTADPKRVLAAVKHGKQTLESVH
jgi:hypothetical protein